jgi:hypothetical protein
MPRPDRDETGFGYGCGLSLGLISPITSSRPGHTGVSPKCTHMRGFAARRRRTPLVGASALHGVSGVSSGSHLGSTLKPGGAVLTRGVSRRSGSVACIRADASPTEVLASPSWHRKRCRSNIIGKKFAVSRASVQIRTLTARVRHVSPAVGTHNLRSAPPRLDGMSTTLQDHRVAAALDRMYTEAREQTPRLRDMRSAMSTARTAQERADAMSTFYIPVTPEAGRLLYSLVRATRPATIVEFGMSFGISALHLAAW